MLTVTQDNRYTAYDNLHKALIFDLTPYQTDEALKDIIAELGTGIGGINTLRKGKLRPTTGSSEAKTEAKQLLADVAGEVAGDMFEWATKTANRSLQADNDYNTTSLFILRGTRIIDITGHILDQARASKAAMGKYAIADTRLQELEDVRLAFDTLRPSPRQLRTQAKALNQTIGQRFSALSIIVQDRFERAIRKYKRLDRPFYDRVIAAREVLDLPGTHASPAPPPPAG